MRVLIVEDEDAIALPLKEGLEREGFYVQRAATGEAALAATDVDIVLLDLRLPDIDGLDVCRQLRSRSELPIIIVSARGEEVDRVVGLELGADDYMVKPFGLREVVARIRAVTRRGGGGQAAAAERIVIGPLVVDVEAHRVTLDDDQLELTPKEFELLALLAAHRDVAVTRQRVMAEIWNSEWYGSTKALDVHVAALRRKLGDPAWIETVRGIGFRLHEPA